MNKKMLVSVLAAGALMSMNTFASDITVEEVLANYAAADASVTAANCEAVAIADVTLNIPDLEMDLGVNAGMDLNIAMDLATTSVAATGTAAVELMGEAMAMDLGIYLVPEGDGLVSYMDMTMNAGEDADREVQKVAISAEETAQIMDMIAQAQSSPMDMTALPVEYTMLDELVDVNGVSCYEVSTTITAEDLPALIDFAMNAAAQAAPEAAAQLPSADDLSMIASMATGMQLNITMDIDAETFMPMGLLIDMDGSDWGVVATLAASALGLTNEDGSLMEVNLTANDLYIAYTYDYSEVGEITVPQDVIDNAVEADMSAVEELAEEMVGEAQTE